MNSGTRRKETVLSVRGAVVVEGLGTWDFVVERTEAAGVRGVDGSGADVVDGTTVAVVVGTDVVVVEGRLAAVPAQPATIKQRAAAPARERAAYQRCCPTGTHGSDRNDAKWWKLGMMAW